MRCRGTIEDLMRPRMRHDTGKEDLLQDVQLSDSVLIADSPPSQLARAFVLIIGLMVSGLSAARAEDVTTADAITGR